MSGARYQPWRSFRRWWMRSMFPSWRGSRGIADGRGMAAAMMLGRRGSGSERGFWPARRQRSTRFIAGAFCKHQKLIRNGRMISMMSVGPTRHIARYQIRLRKLGHRRGALRPETDRTKMSRSGGAPTVIRLCGIKAIHHCLKQSET